MRYTKNLISSPEYTNITMMNNNPIFSTTDLENHLDFLEPISGLEDIVDFDDTIMSTVADMANPITNPSFLHDEERIVELQQELEAHKAKLLDTQRQLQHHKALSEQLQTIALVGTVGTVGTDADAKDPLHNAEPNTNNQKRKYTHNEDTIKMRSFIRDHMNDKTYANDLINGVGFHGVPISHLPKSLLRAYIAFRYKIDGAEQ